MILIFASFHFHPLLFHTPLYSHSHFILNKKIRKVGLRENEALSALTVDSTSCWERPRNNEKVPRVGDFVPKCANITNLFQNKKLPCWNFERDFWKIQFVKISFLPHLSPRRLPIRLRSKETPLRKKSNESSVMFFWPGKIYVRKLYCMIYVRDAGHRAEKWIFSFFSRYFLGKDAQ